MEGVAVNLAIGFEVDRDDCIVEAARAIAVGIAYLASVATTIPISY